MCRHVFCLWVHKTQHTCTRPKGCRLRARECRIPFTSWTRARRCRQSDFCNLSFVLPVICVTCLCNLSPVTRVTYICVICHLSHVVSPGFIRCRPSDGGTAPAVGDVGSLGAIGLSSITRPLAHREKRAIEAWLQMSNDETSNDRSSVSCCLG